jgi:hypothetical protein
MKKQFILVSFLLISVITNSQTAKDLFNSSNVKVNWLGVDFSHVKLIGDFSQFYGTGSKSNAQIRDVYFSGWNNIILAEPAKYDIKGMLRLSEIYYDIDMIMEINSTAKIEDLESYNNPNYSKKDIEGFISSYKIENSEGIGVLLVAECLNKNAEEAYFHFVAINMITKEILIYERLRGEPMGIGLRNYWAGSVYSVIKDIKKKHYKIWKKRFL